METLLDYRSDSSGAPSEGGEPAPKRARQQSAGCVWSVSDSERRSSRSPDRLPPHLPPLPPPPLPAGPLLLHRHCCRQPTRCWMARTRPHQPQRSGRWSRPRCIRQVLPLVALRGQGFMSACNSKSTMRPRRLLSFGRCAAGPRARLPARHWQLCHPCVPRRWVGCPHQPASRCCFSALRSLCWATAAAALPGSKTRRLQQTRPGRRLHGGIQWRAQPPCKCQLLWPAPSRSDSCSLHAAKLPWGARRAAAAAARAAARSAASGARTQQQ